MPKMRKQLLECRDRQKIDRFLQQARIGFLGLSDADGPYVVPLNFIWSDGRIYFHGADAGRKTEIMRTDAAACFTVCEEMATMVHPVPAHTSTAYLSVMLFGRVHPVSGLDEATEAMQRMLDKYVPGYFNRPLSATHVEKHFASSYGASIG